MPPAIDREDRAAAAKSGAAARRRQKAKARRERRKKLELARETAATKAAARPSGKVEEDGSFGTPTGRVYDPDTKKVRDIIRTPQEKKRRRKVTAEFKAETKATRAAARKPKEKDEDWTHKSLLELAGGPKLKAGFDIPFIDDDDVKELESSIVGMPAGVYKLGKDAVNDVRDLDDLVSVRPRGSEDRRPFARTGENAKAIGETTYRDVRHPLRNPLMTGLTLSGLASAGAGTASRGAAAAGALRAGEGIGAAAGKAIARPIPGVRFHTFEGKKIRGRYSRDSFYRGVQKLNDKRTGGAVGAKKAERLLSEERRVTDAAAKAKALKVLADSKSTTTVENMAIDAMGVGLPLNERIEIALAKAAKAKSKGERKRWRREAGLLEAARPLLGEDARGRPIVTDAKLAEKVKHAEEAMARRESELQRTGNLSPEAAEARKHGPGRVLRGAKFMPKSLAESKGAAFNLVGKRVRTADGTRGVLIDVKGDTATIRPWSRKKETFEAPLDEVYPATRKVKQGTLVGGGRAITKERPRTLAEAQARADKIEAWLEPRLEKMTKLARRMNPEAFQGFTGGGARGGTGRVIDDFKIGQGQTARYVEDPRAQRAPGKAISGDERARAYVEQRLAKGTHPLEQKMAAAMDELDELKTAIRQEQERGMGIADPKETARSLGTETETTAIEAFEGGRFRIPEALPTKRKTHGPVAYRGGIPRKPGTLTNPYTGAARRVGAQPRDTLRAIAEDALQAESYLSVDRFRKRVLPMAHEARPADGWVNEGGRMRKVRYVPVKERPLKKTEADKLRRELQDVELENLTPDEAARVEEAIKAFQHDLFPPVEQFAGAGVGAKIPGVRWIDETLLGSQKKLVGSLGPVDVVQDAVKGLILYGKPGYVTPNILGNVGYNLFQQGFLAPLNWSRAVKLPKDLGFQVDEIMGAGFSRSLAEGTTSRISGGVQKAGNFWSTFVDTPFRRASFIHEARTRGFKTEAQMRDLIENPNHRALIGEIGQRARDAIVDYERMGPFERDIVRRVLFVYPWVKGSTYYAGQFLRDHPIQAAVFTKIGEEGSEWSEDMLGRLPAWAKGSFPVFKRGDRQFISNPQSVSWFGTPAQVMAAARGGYEGVERSENLGEMTAPVLQAGIESVFGRDLFTGRELEGGYPERFGKQLVKGLPQYNLGKRILEADDPETQEKSYPYGVGSALGQFFGGSAAPRPANLDELNEQAKERRAAKRDKIAEERKAVLPALAGKWDREDMQFVRHAYDVYEGIEAIRAKVQDETESGEPYYRRIVVDEATYMQKLGVFDAEDVKWAKRIAKTGTYDEVKKLRDRWVQTTYESLYAKPTRNAAKAAGYERP